MDEVFNQLKSLTDRSTFFRAKLLGGGSKSKINFRRMGGRIGEFGRGGGGGCWSLIVSPDFSRLSANSHSVGRIENLGYSHVNTSNGRGVNN